MKQQEMHENLTKQAQEISQELQQLEKDFNFKKEQFFRIQGALEVLNALETPSVTPEVLQETEV
jgi:hypothetical protein